MEVSMQIEERVRVRLEAEVSMQVRIDEVEREYREREGQVEKETLIMCGKRKSTPDCRPLPRPMDDSTPRPIHQTANSTANSHLLIHTE
jgi:hypothetical protein